MPGAIHALVGGATRVGNFDEYQWGISASVNTVEVCDRGVDIKRWQLCQKHYQALWKFGDPEGSGMVYGQRCAAPGCEETRGSKEGLCFMHRQRLYRWGSIEREELLCSKEGCGGTVSAKGLCQRHYDRMRGSARGLGRICSRDDCDNHVKARGLCRKHYGALQRAGQLNSAPSRADERTELAKQVCSQPECERPVQLRGFCSIHINRVRAGNRMFRGCRTCNHDMTGLPRGQRYCSEECKPHCTVDCGRRASGKGLCSTHAKQAKRGEQFRPIAVVVKRDPNSPCVWCESPTGADNTGAYCSLRCAGLARRHKMIEVIAACAQCGEAIDYLAPAGGSSGRLTPTNKRLCDECQHHNPAHYLSVEDVRARDGDDCCICGLNVPERLPRYHPLAAHVDHRVSRAQGGSHDDENLGLAHSLCNIAKRDRPADWRKNPADIQQLLDDLAIHPNPPDRIEPKPCSVDGCADRATTNRMCQKHRRRFVKTGTTDLRPRPKTCSAADCSGAVRARGLCRKHYSAWLGSRGICERDGCAASAYARGLCRPHYRVALKDRGPATR